MAWMNVMAPGELLHAMDIIPFMPELHCGIIASQMDVFQYTEAASGYGYAVKLCLFHRIILTMAHKGEISLPDLLIHTSQVCDASFKDFDLLSNFYKIPAFMLDQPRWHDEYDEEVVKYYQNDLEALVDFLEKNTGKKLDYDRLNEVMKLSKTAREYQFEHGELRKQVPVPVHAKEAFRTFNISRWMAGRQEAVGLF